MTTKDHLSAARKIIDFTLAEFFDHNNKTESDFDLKNSLLELLLYRVLDHIVNAST